MNYIETMDPIPAGANPFHYDAYNQGASFGPENRMVAMFNDRMAFVILIDRASGKRIKIHLGDEPSPEVKAVEIPDHVPILKIDEWDHDNNKVGM